MEPLYSCPCCGYLTLIAPSPGSWLVCPICYWEDDLSQYEDPTLIHGANYHSLSVAQYNFTRIGTIDECYKNHVRTPTEKDLKDPNWKPAYKIIERGDRQPIELIEDAFAETLRPQHFTLYWHCYECLEHNETMRAAERGKLKLDPNWNAVNFLTPEGFQYFMPDFVRLALEDEEDGFLRHFVTFCLSSRKSPKKSLEIDNHLALFNRNQFEVTLKFLEYVKQTRWIELEYDMERLEQVISEWRHWLASYEKST